MSLGPARARVRAVTISAGLAPLPADTNADFRAG
jgi:hypothetical protein